jgi:predicted TIM-barrel fold metal-dependent hydrolase
MGCDCHVHIVGPADIYPQLATRTYLALPAPLAELQRLGASHDISRFVLVQPSFYGTDNRLLLESLTALGGRGRGVAVIDPRHTDGDTLTDYARRGVCGLRINLYSPLIETGSLANNFVTMAAVAQAMNWHIEVIAPLAMLAASCDVLMASPATVVIDHYGVYGSLQPDSAEGQRLLELLRRPHVWMKLSAPYRSSNNALLIRPDPAWLSAILAVAMDRCVWGSDWPFTPPHEAQKGGHVPTPHRKIAYRQVVDDFLMAIGEARLAEDIMSSNPRRLYGF